METTGDLIPDSEIQQKLRTLFDAAAAKSLAVIDSLDAEPEMARFLHEVQKNPDQRGFVVQLFIHSFSDSFYMRHEPSQLLMFCMYDLRWPELREYIKARRHEEVERIGARCSGVWNDILESFEDKWVAAKYFEEFKNRNPGSAQEGSK
jgi:hypothetical protein